MKPGAWASLALASALTACEIFSPLGHLQDHHADAPACKPNTGGPNLLRGVTAISARGSHTCALGFDGSVACWGSNSYGANADPQDVVVDRTPYTSIASAFDAGHAIALAAGSAHACAAIRGASSGVFCWGIDSFGETGPLPPGNSGFDPNPQPELVPTADPQGSPPFRAGSLIAAGANFTCATDNASAVWCWGNNDYGTLGQPTSGGSDVPLLIPDVTNARLLAAGDHHACAALGDSVSCWGLDDAFELGSAATTGCSTNDATPCSPMPQAIPSSGPDFQIAHPVLSIAAGYTHTCMVDGANGLYCWGGHDAGQTGDVSPGVIVDTPESLHPVAGLPAGRHPVSVAAAGRTTCFVEDDGTVGCFGANDHGQLGSPADAADDAGVLPMHTRPVQVPGVSNVTALAVGDDHVCAVEGCGSGGGVVLCWGANDVGQLGNDSTTDSVVPVSVLAPTSR